MKLSLVFPAWSEEFKAYKHAAKKVSTFPPLNLCIIAALAEKEGWEVQVIDAHIEQIGHWEVAERVAAFGPDLIGLTATTPFFHTAVLQAKMLKERVNAPIIMGGTHVSICRQEAFNECFDYLAIGECELNFPEFIKQFSAGKQFPEVPGIMMRKNGELLYHGDALLIEDLDKAPMPARHLLPNEKYFMGTLRGRKHYTSVQMSRGCPFSCVFCACDLHGKSFRLRSVENVLKELELVVNKFGADHIYFIDDTLTLNRKFILSLCDAIKRSGLKFTFEGSTRANLWDEEMVRSLKECGLIRISFGLESADPYVRELIKKNVPIDSYEESNRLCNRLGIETINSVIIGLPGDTRESIERTVAFLCRAKDLHHVTLNIAMPYPGTEMHRMAETGRHGLRLVEHDYAKYQRYGSAVMEVNGIAPDELIEIQKKALIQIYSCWWRIIPVIRRFGLMTLVITGFTTVIRPLIMRLMRRKG